MKIHGERQQFYPIPPKTMCPNLQTREGDMVVAPRTANALRNVEREQWRTSHQNDFSGLGPCNPVVLDNLEEKRNKFIMTGLEDDRLVSQSGSLGWSQLTRELINKVHHDGTGGRQTGKSIRQFGVESTHKGVN